MHFLDTNVILRYLTQDHPDHGPRAYAFLQRVERGEIAATLSEAVIAEVIYVLSSKALYNVSRAEIQTRLVTVLNLKGMRLHAKGTCLRALDLYATTNLDFVDALLVAQVERVKNATLVSFDRGYSNITTVQRAEP
ncbi:MAG: PIN domain-containing protein [Thermomicrobiales bacterium]